MIRQLPSLPHTVAAGAVPSWLADDVCHRPCPVCVADAPVPLVKRPDGFVPSRCADCGMIYLADAPTDEQLASFYARYSDFKGYQPSRSRGLKKLLHYANNPYISMLQATGGIRHLRVLDIGCSYGAFLQLVRHAGGLPYGVELDESAQQFLDTLDIPCAAAVESLSVDFDVVCAFQLFEHLMTPSAMLSAITKTLKPDGRVLISIPNGGEFEKVGPAWVGFRVDFEHLNYFSLKSLSNLLHAHGLYVEHFWEHFQPSIARRQSSGESSRVVQAGRILRRAANKWLTSLLKEHGMADNGSFVLTVIARKA